jgi:hypothetical protein
MEVEETVSLSMFNDAVEIGADDADQQALRSIFVTSVAGDDRLLAERLSIVRKRRRGRFRRARAGLGP